MKTINTMTINKTVIESLKIVANKNEELAVSLIQEISSGYDKDAAQRFLDLMVLNRQSYKDAIVNGNNKSYNGNTRYWVSAKCTGVHKTNKYGHKMIEVIDPYSNYETRWLKLTNFTGTITYINNEVSTWDKGKETSTRNIKNEHFDRTFEHKQIIVKEYFDMNHEQWEIFTKCTPVHVQQEMIDMCIKEQTN